MNPATAGANQRRSFAPDVRVFGAVENLIASNAGEGGVALAPFRLMMLDEPAVERSIEIIDIRGGERLVTVIEFISPTNKTDGLKSFIEKRNELLGGGVNVVEIDLVRTGDWQRLLGHPCPAEAEAAYRAVLRLPANPPEAYLHPFPLRKPLPAIKIPLRAGEAPCELALQPLIEQAYKNGRYDRTIDYRRECEPAFEGEDARWAHELLVNAGRR